MNLRQLFSEQKNKIDETLELLATQLKSELELKSLHVENLDWNEREALKNLKQLFEEHQIDADNVFNTLKSYSETINEYMRKDFHRFFDIIEIWDNIQRLIINNQVIDGIDSVKQMEFRSDEMEEEPLTLVRKGRKKEQLAIREIIGPKKRERDSDEVLINSFNQMKVGDGKEEVDSQEHKRSAKECVQQRKQLKGKRLGLFAHSSQSLLQDVAMQLDALVISSPDSKKPVSQNNKNLFALTWQQQPSVGDDQDTQESITKRSRFSPGK